MDNPDVRGWPLWRWVVLGWMATAALAAWTWNPHPPAEVLAEELEGRAPEWELAELSERELRALPAVGPARAADIVETRWRTPPEVPLVLEEVPGIGPGTAGEVRAFLERQRPVRRSPLARSSPSPRSLLGSAPEAEDRVFIQTRDLERTAADVRKDRKRLR